jgi:hypothetical protein
MLFYERRADTTIKPVDFEYDDAEITETIAQIKKDKSLDDIDEDDGYTSSKNKAGASSSSSSGASSLASSHPECPFPSDFLSPSGYYTSTSSSAGNSGVAGIALSLDTPLAGSNLTRACFCGRREGAGVGWQPQ